ncbi:S-adenosyl-L-methionine-dependent methyltransferase [Sistotremastrum niveocremeum HHB9708]|uniref:Trimethylguanosine synthase n=1 Tax=Sistotremastrum niveocremeum HHB9708 TaxID=1314777 RepID=A0A164W9N8_9AGAM|nr:S-adenosyl-L-methionine-dependent methyltransferase [Sistotremastrum niveocremeum HHB9708]
MGKRGPSSLFSALPKELADTLKSSIKSSGPSNAEPGPSAQSNTLQIASSSATTLQVSDPYEGYLASDRVAQNDEGPPNKKQKRSQKEKQKERRSSVRGKYDASDLVTRYTNEAHVPEHLKKYFAQRYRYFSLYDQGCLLDEEGWYSVTPEALAQQIAERCRCDTILDAFCGVGGNAIAFAQTCERVIAMDISPIRLALARHNAAIYGVEDRIEFILGDYVSFAKSLMTPEEDGSNSQPRRKIDVVFLSPPWGGPSYLTSQGTNDSTHASLPGTGSEPEESHPSYNLAALLPIPGAELFTLTRRITPNIAFFLPKNVDLKEISELVQSSGSTTPESEPDPATEMIEIEEEWMGSKLKALTCYFGGLVEGQSDIYPW